MSLRKRPLSVGQFFGFYLLSLTGVGLVYLGITGKMHWLAALIGGAMPFLSGLFRGGFRIFRTIALFRNLSGQFNRFAGSGFTGGQKAGQSSSIKTTYLDMSLDHDSGDLDGIVLLGRFEGQSLSELDQKQLTDLVNECRSDQDSVNVLVAYMDRNHPDWREQNRAEPEASAGDEMNQDQALAILGLETDATQEEIIVAHRRLIQKMHPDRGGSTFLAARINEARTLLIQDRKA